MPKSTLAFLIFLAVLASLLFGINIGKKLGVSQYLAQLVPTISPVPTTSVQKPTATPKISVYTDKYCGFSLSYPKNFIEQKSESTGSAIIANSDYPDESIITACQEEIPKPPLTPEKIEDITIDGVKTLLYHDASSKDGSPRDEVIIKHPTLNHEIIIAGFGPAFNEAVSSFKFIR